MIERTVLFLTFTDQGQSGFSGRHGIDLNCSTDLDKNWHAPLRRVFRQVHRYDIFSGANQGGICAANCEILEIAGATRPDYVIYPCNFSGIVTTSTLATLRARGSVVVGYLFDDDTYFHSLSKWMIPCIDYFVSGAVARGIVAAYEALGARAILALPFPINPEVFFRIDGSPKRYDATFIGGLHANRRDYLAEIGRHGVPVAYLGGGHHHKLHHGRLTEVYNRSRINLNFTSGQISGPAARHLTGRIFEITMSGGFLLTEYADGLEEYFEPGREIACFEGPSEAADKIRYYLEHPEERDEIAARGHMRATREYTGDEMLRKVFLSIEEDLSRRGRPQPVAPVEGVNPVRRADAEQYYRWAHALLESPPPLRDAWRETAELVLATNPSHDGATRLLQRNERWGDSAQTLLRAVRSIVRRLRSGLSSFRVSAARAVPFPRRTRFALEVEEFRKRYWREPAPLDLCIDLRARASIVSGDVDPLLPAPSQLFTSGAHLRDAHLATILHGVELGRWTIASDTVEWLSDFLQRERPQFVLEFGCGVSTVCLCVMLQRLHGPDGFRLLSLEQTSAEAERTRERLRALSGGASCRVVNVPLIPAVVAGKSTSCFDLNGTCTEDFAWLGKAEFVFIDGPAAEGPSRYGTLTGVPSTLVSGARFAMDDGLREEELLAGNLWSQRGIVVDGVLTHGKGLMIGSLP